MCVLVIHAPRAAEKSGNPSFEETLECGIGKDYAISESQFKMIRDDCKVVLLRKDGRKKRAESWLIKLVPTSKTPQGIQRYDVHFHPGNEHLVPYMPEGLNKFGVALDPCT